MKLYIGLDLSSTNTGMAVLGEGGVVLKHFLFSPNKALSFDERVLEILDNILEYIDDELNKGFDIAVAIEGGAFHGVGKRNELAMLNGVVYYSILRRKISVILVAPSRLKKFATGNGRASKEDMLNVLPDSWIELFKKQYKKYDDVVDAYHLAEFIRQNS